MNLKVGVYIKEIDLSSIVSRFLKKRTTIEKDEVLCDKCNGTGKDDDPWECNKCHGTGKLTWLENILGKDPEYIKYTNYIRI